MVALLKRIRQFAHVEAWKLEARKSTGAILPASQSDAPSIRRNDGNGDEPTPASWPTVQKSAEIFRWGGGCCG